MHKSLSEKKRQILFLRSKEKCKKFSEQSYNLIKCDFEESELLI